MYLTGIEYDLFRLFEAPCFGWGDTLRQQLKNASISQKKYTNSIFIDFLPDYRSPKVDVVTEIPIEIIIGDVVLPSGNVLCRIDGFPVTDASVVMVPDSSAYAVRLHFREGYIKELEAYSLSGGPLDLSKLYTSMRTYLIHDPEKFLHLYKSTAKD